MATRNFVCLVLGHKWTRERMPNRTLRLTCKRCGDIDVVEKDFDVGKFGGGAGGGFGGGGGGGGGVGF
jgi:hypothetical protein